MKKLAYVPYIQMTASMLLIGSMFVVSKLIVAYVPVMTASFFRVFLGFLTLCAVLVWRRMRAGDARFDVNLLRPVVCARDAGILFIQIFCGIFLFSLLILWGVKYTRALDASIITSATPLSMMLFGVVFLGERMTGRRGLAVLLALSGAIVMNVMSASVSTKNAPNVWLGNGLMALAVLLEGVFFGAQKLLSRPITPLWLMILLMGGASVLFAPFAVYDFATRDLSVVPWTVWALVVYTGVGVTAVGVLLMHAALPHVPNSSAAIFTALMPVSGVLLSVWVLGEVFSLYHLLGMALVLLGMGLVVWEKRGVRGNQGV